MWVRVLNDSPYVGYWPEYFNLARKSNDINNTRIAGTILWSTISVLPSTLSKWDMHIQVGQYVHTCTLEYNSVLATCTYTL